MRKFFPLLVILALSGCGDEPPPEVSRVQPAAGIELPSMNYQGYRSYISQRAQAGDSWATDIMSQEYGESSTAIQKRFMALDRNGDGHISDAELNP